MTTMDDPTHATAVICFCILITGFLLVAAFS
jgi:hypothetical protein